MSAQDTTQPAAPQRGLGVWSGVGLVVANMVGTGVFLSTGFMAQELGPGQILLAWVLGCLIALCGTRAYAALATLVPRSGGEYRFLAELLHPSLGYFAGWVTLLVGFSAPIAVNALAAAEFTGTLLPTPSDARWLASVYVIVLTALHARDLHVSRWTQDLLALLKVALVLGFVLLGFSGGQHGWPTWVPPHAPLGTPFAAMATSLFFIAFAFSGWNAAAYAAEEFDDPPRTVPRAMLIGCGLVAVFYLLVNWVFVANLTPERARVVFEYETARVTLGHLIATDILGAVGGKIMSILALISFLSCISAMVFAGPRVYAAMAEDGFLPGTLRRRAGRPPAGSIWFQGLVTLAMVQSQAMRAMLANVGAILTLVCALTILGLLRRWLRPNGNPRPPAVAVVCGLLFVLAALITLPFGLAGSTDLWRWLVGLIGLSFAGYWLAPRSASATPA